MTSPMKIEYLAEAQKDRQDIFNYIAKENHTVAEQELKEFDISVNRLRQNPLLGTKPRNRKLERMGYRILMVQNHEVLYTVNGNIIEIRHIIHGWLKKQ